MGNLLRVLYNRDDSPAKVDIFVDFESKSCMSYLKLMVAILCDG